MGFYTRAQVGIDPPAAAYRGAPSIVVIHHGGDTEGSGTLERGMALWRSYDAYHASKGWGGVGYHRGIVPSGDVLEGRDLDQVAVAAPGYNTTGAHYCFVDNGESPSTAAARRALVDQIAADGLAHLPVVCHRDVTNTSCPNDANAEWVHAGLPLPDPDPLQLQGRTLMVRK